MKEDLTKQQNSNDVTQACGDCGETKDNLPNKEDPNRESNLVKHARKELQIAGLFDKDSDYNGETANAVMELIKVFSKQEHSGASAGMVSIIFNKLAKFETIAPLTGNDDEWVLVAENLYQNNRNSAVFKEGKNAQAHYIDAIVWKTQKGAAWSGISSCGISSRQYIKSFPFQPVTFFIDVTKEEVKKDDWVFHVKDQKDLDKVWKVYDRNRKFITENDRK